MHIVLFLYSNIVVFLAAKDNISSHQLFTAADSGETTYKSKHYLIIACYLLSQSLLFTDLDVYLCGGG